jgi:hypothetical protein
LSIVLFFAILSQKFNMERESRLSFGGEFSFVPCSEELKSSF